MIFLFTFPLTAEEFVKWTNPEGKEIDATFVELTDTQVVLKLKGQQQPIKLDHAKLSNASLDQARRFDEEKKAKDRAEAAKSTTQFKIGNQWIPRGKKSTIDVEIGAEAAQKELSKFYGKPTTLVKITAVVAEKFDPKKEDCVVVVCHAPHGNGNGLSASEIRIFEKVALEENALVIAIDGEFGNPGKNDLPTFRSFLLFSCLNSLEADYPLKKWRFIHAGNSGGSGNASFCAMYMISDGYRVGGVYMGVGNYSPLMWDSSYKLKPNEKKNFRLYYSFGKNDNVCPTDLQDKVLKELKASPYSNVRVSYHMKGHGYEESHFREAFQWFKEPLAN